LHLEYRVSFLDKRVNILELLGKVVYVVINSLPRDALVEWQVVAERKSQNDASTSYSETIFIGKLTIRAGRASFSFQCIGWTTLYNIGLFSDLAFV